MLILKTNSINDSLNLPGTYCLNTCWSTLCKKNTINNEKTIIKWKNIKKKCIIDLLYYKTPEVDLEIDVTVVINPHYEEGVKQMKTN